MKSLIFSLLLIISTRSLAQFELLNEDSLKNRLVHTDTRSSATRTAAALELLGRKVPGTPYFDSLRDVIIEEVESSRDRSQMCSAYLSIARDYLGYEMNSELIQKSKSYIDRAAAIASESALDEYQIGAYLQYAHYFRALGQRDKALAQDNQAINLTAAMQGGRDAVRDSLLCVAYSSLSFTWDLFANKLARFQALLSAREFAEQSAIDKLIVVSDIDLADFYADAEQYEKSKDYCALAIQKGKDAGLWQLVIQAMQRMAAVYVAQPEKNKEFSLSWYNKALHIADSLKLSDYQVQLHLDILNYYLNYETPEKSIAYLQTQPEVSRFIDEVGAGYQVNKLYATACEHRQHYDSALYFMRQGAPYEYGQANNYREKYEFTMLYSRILEKMALWDDLRDKLLLAKRFADSANNLNLQEDVSQQLDSVYQKLGDYKNAFYY
ncbi:MAG TPA: hypothetical protein VG890_01365, partial [Puia sp.]|nr:hypothetical protein [Puia sp.]